MSIEILRQLVERGQVATCREIEAAIAEYDRLRAALVKVEVYMASEEGPIETLWENCDIGDYDEYQTDWEQTLFDVRDWKNGCVPVASLGGGTEWPVIVLYREVLQALAPEPAEPPAEKEDCPGCGKPTLSELPGVFKEGEGPCKECGWKAEPTPVEPTPAEKKEGTDNG